MSFINQTGYIGIFLLMTAEAALIPIPSEVTMPFSGFLSTTGRFNLFLVIFIGTFGDLTGSMLAYWLGHWGEDRLIRSWIKKYGKYLLISEGEYDQSESWFRKYGQNIIFVSRLLPVIRTFISLPAGVSKMSFVKFSLFTFLGSLIWTALLAIIGFYLGKNWNSIEIYYRRFEYIVLFLVAGLAIFYIYRKLKHLRK